MLAFQKNLFFEGPQSSQNQFKIATPWFRILILKLFYKKIGGAWSPPRHFVRKIWHQTHVLKATAMRLEFLKNFWVEKNIIEASKRDEIRRNFWVNRSIIFQKTSIFSFSFNKKWLVGRGMLPLPPIESADHLRLKTYA